MERILGKEEEMKTLIVVVCMVLLAGELPGRELQVLERQELRNGLVREELLLPGWDPSDPVPAIAIYPILVLFLKEHSLTPGLLTQVGGGDFGFRIAHSAIGNLQPPGRWLGPRRCLPPFEKRSKTESKGGTSLGGLASLVPGK